MNRNEQARCKFSTHPLPAAPTVYIVDADPSIHERLAPLISAAGWNLTSCASATYFLSLPRLTAAACVLLELRLPDMSGLEVQRLIAARRELPIIFFTSEPDLPAIVQAMKGGALEFLLKPCSPEQIVGRIKEAIEASRTELRKAEGIWTILRRFQSLSRRERDVMRLLVRGHLNKQVGIDLGITEITVKGHRRQVMQKMRADSFAELVIMATRLRQDSPIDVGILIPDDPVASLPWLTLSATVAPNELERRANRGPGGQGSAHLSGGTLPRKRFPLEAMV